jgi:uridylate kinase
LIFDRGQIDRFFCFLIYVKIKGMTKKDVLVIALGGSVIMPGKINTRLLRNFRKLISRQLKRGRHFIIVAGGGKLARFYQAAAGKITHLSYEDMDWLGIHSTRLNAHLLRTIFRSQADPVVIDSEEKPIKLDGKVIIASGWQPGWSTDYIAVRLAKKIGSQSVIIAGRPAFVYTKDHQKYKDAKPIRKISWRNYRKLISSRWIPGMSAPVDPVGAKAAEKWGIKAIIVKGTNLKNLENLLEGRKFVGTIIS